MRTKAFHTTKWIVIWSAAIFGITVMAFAQVQETPPAQTKADEPSAQTIVKKHGKTPSEWPVLDDGTTFAGVTARIDAAAPDSDLIVRNIQKLPEYKMYTGGFLFTTDGLIPDIKVAHPKPGTMIVKVILDLYSDKEPMSREDAFDSPGGGENMTGPLWSEVLWRDDIALLSGDGSPVELMSLMLAKGRYVVIGFDGLDIWKGGNRIAIVFAGKEADPTKLHLRIRGKDYGTLDILKR